MDKSNNNSDKARDAFLFQHLVVMFQTLALQQMGKLTSPITGKVERDLHQAKITVDMLGMIQKKTEGNLAESERKLLDTVLMELQMNYIDETSRTEKEEEGKQEEEKGQEAEEGPETGGEDEEQTPDA